MKRKFAISIAAFYVLYVVCSAFMGYGGIQRAKTVYRGDGIYCVGVDVRQSGDAFDYNLKCGSKTLDQGELLNVYVDEGYGIYKIYMNGKSVDYTYAGYDSTKYRNRFTCEMPAENITVSADVADILLVNPLKYNTYKTGTFGSVGDSVSYSKLNFTDSSIVVGYMTPDTKANEDDKTATIAPQEATYKIISKGSLSTKNPVKIQANYHGVYSEEFTVYESPNASTTGDMEVTTPTTTQTPATTTKAPTTTQAPATTKAPATTQAPATTTKAPATTTKAPATTTQAPVVPKYDANLQVSGNVANTTISTSSIAANKTRITAVAGTTVTIKTAETEQYIEPVVTVDNKPAVQKDDTTFTFAMPSKNITVNVTYKIIDSLSITAPTLKNYGSHIVSSVSDLNLNGGGAVATYKSVNGTTTDTFSMNPKWCKIQNDDSVKNGTKVNHTVTVLASYSYAGKTANVTFTITYETAAEKYKASLYVSGNGAGTTIQTASISANKTGVETEGGTIVAVKVAETEQYVSPLVTTSTGTTVTKVDDETYTFVMPEENVGVTVIYRTINKFTVTNPTKTNYGSTLVNDKSILDLTGGEIKVEYTSAVGTIEKEFALNKDWCTLGKETVSSNGRTVTHTVQVQVSYGGKNGSFSVTYTTEIPTITHQINLQLAGDASVASNMASGDASKSSIQAGDNSTVTVTVPTSNQYIKPIIKVTKGTGGTINTTQVDDTHYTFPMPDQNVTVSVTYQVFDQASIVTPTKTNYGQTVITNPSQLDFGTAGLQVVYKRTGESDTTVTIPMDENWCEFEKTTSQTDVKGNTVYTIPVQVKYEFNGNEYKKSFQIQYSEIQLFTATMTATAGSTTTIESSKTTPNNKEVVGESDETITIKTTTNEQYIKPEVIVKAGSTTVDVTKTAEDTYEFTMPASNVTVTVDYFKAQEMIYTKPDKLEYTQYTQAGYMDWTGSSVQIKYLQESTNKVENVNIDATQKMDCFLGQGQFGDAQKGVYTVNVPVKVKVNLAQEYGLNGAFSFKYIYHAYTLTATSNLEEEISSIDFTTEAGDSIVTAQENDKILVKADTTSPILSVKVVDADNKTLTCTKVKKGVYSFIMPSGPVTVNVQYDIPTLTFDKTQCANKVFSLSKCMSIADMDFSSIYMMASYSDGTSKKIYLNNASITKSIVKMVSKKDSNGFRTKKYEVAFTYAGQKYTFDYSAKIPLYMVGFTVNPVSMNSLVRLDKTQAEAGETVTFTCAKSNGKAALKAKVLKEELPNNNNRFIFAMPEQDITVFITYGTDPNPNDPGPTFDSNKTQVKPQKKPAAAATTECITPSKPATVTVKAKSKKLTVSWSKVAKAKYYDVYVSTKAGSGYKKIARVSGKKNKYIVKKFKNKALKKKTTYYVQVQAVNEVSIPFVKIKNTSAKASKGVVKVKWKKVKDGKRYTIYLSDKKNGVYKKAGSVKAGKAKSYKKSYKKCAGKKVKNKKKYFIRIVTNGAKYKYYYSAKSQTVKIKCK